jgi:hypothetical protein
LGATPENPMQDQSDPNRSRIFYTKQIGLGVEIYIQFVDKLHGRYAFGAHALDMMFLPMRQRVQGPAPASCMPQKPNMGMISLLALACLAFA